MENDDEEGGFFDKENLENPLYEKHLFSLSPAVDEVRHAIGVGETAGATAKLVGKTVANTAVIAAKLGWITLKGVAATAEKLAAEAAKAAK
jgi:hypothetical protein